MSTIELPRDRTTTMPPGGVDRSMRPVDRPVMLMRWEDLAYVHWRVRASEVQPLLPEGLTTDTHGGSAFVGLVPFQMRSIRLPGTPGVPYLGTFPETNVRTYVVGPDGRAGVYFSSLDVTRLLPVAVAQLAYRLPYAWSAMSIERSRDRIAYVARRRWPSPRGARSALDVVVGPRVAEPTALDTFLADRWALYADAPSGALYRADVEHPPWPLHAAKVATVQDELVAAAGYPSRTTASPPVHVRFSPGVDVRVGAPRRVR